MINRKQVVRYVLFGFLATVVYFVTRFSFRMLTSNVLIPVVLGQLAGLLFSFLCNKYFVFKHIRIGWVQSFRQFVDFFISRIVVFFFDLGMSHLFVDRYADFWMRTLRLQQINYQNRFFSFPALQKYMGSPALLNEFIFTVVTQLLAGIINYVISKRLIFNIKKQQEVATSV